MTVLLKTKVLFDTPIYLRALIDSRSACGQLLFEWDQHYQLFVCNKLVSEIVTVLRQSSFSENFSPVTAGQIRFLIGCVAVLPRIQMATADIEPCCVDPKDDILLACAKVAQIDYVVTEDNNLLMLPNYHNVKIINVASFLSILESKDETPSTNEP